MKRMLQFKSTDSGYACFENNKNVFEISKANLQFNVKTFQIACYNEEKSYEEIEIENCIHDDKSASRVFDCIVQLIARIKEKLSEMPEDTPQSE